MYITSYKFLRETRHKEVPDPTNTRDLGPLTFLQSLQKNIKIYFSHMQQHISRSSDKKDSHEWRCSCGRLLFKGVFLVGIIEAKCPRCKSIVYLQEYRAFTAGKDSMMIILSPNGTIVSTTSTIKNVLGFEAADAIGINIKDCLPGDYQEVVQYWLDKIFQITQDPEPYFSAVISIINSAGEPVPLAFFAKAVEFKGKRHILSVADSDKAVLERFVTLLSNETGPKNLDFGRQFTAWDFSIDSKGDIIDTSPNNALNMSVDLKNKPNLISQIAKFSSQDPVYLAKSVLSDCSKVVELEFSSPLISGKYRVCFSYNKELIGEKDEYIVSFLKT